MIRRSTKDTRGKKTWTWLQKDYKTFVKMCLLWASRLNLLLSTCLFAILGLSLKVASLIMTQFFSRHLLCCVGVRNHGGYCVVGKHKPRNYQRLSTTPNHHGLSFHGCPTVFHNRGIKSYHGDLLWKGEKDSDSSHFSCFLIISLCICEPDNDHFRLKHRNHSLFLSISAVLSVFLMLSLFR